jgi:hypothetical protein
VGTNGRTLVYLAYCQRQPTQVPGSLEGTGGWAHASGPLSALLVGDGAEVCALNDDICPRLIVSSHASSPA